MTPAAVRATIAPIGAAARRAPGEIAVVIVVEPSSPVPGDDVRAAFGDLIRADHAIRATVIVAEGSGFRSSLVRSVVTSLLLLARQTAPMKVTSTVPEAAKWAAAQGATRAGSELEREVVQAVEAARGKIGASAGARSISGGGPRAWPWPSARRSAGSPPGGTRRARPPSPRARAASRRATFSASSSLSAPTVKVAKSFVSPGADDAEPLPLGEALGEHDLHPVVERADLGSRRPGPSPSRSDRRMLRERRDRRGARPRSRGCCA